jgi:hypothetical protein
MEYLTIHKRFIPSQIDIDGFLADPDITSITLRTEPLIVQRTDPEGEDLLPPERLRLEKRRGRLEVDAALDETNYATVTSKLQEHQDSILIDPNNNAAKAKKFRAKNESESFIDLVPDVPTKQAFQKLKEYIDLISGE